MTTSAPTSDDLGAVHRTLRRSAAPGSGSASTRWADPRWRTGSRSRERYGLNITVVNPAVDPTFRFMPLDWDGKIRMDCSSPFAMAGLIAMTRPVRRRLRKRHGRRPARDRDADRRPAQPEPLSCGGDRLPFPEPGRVGKRRRDREDGREQRDDRSRGGAPFPPDGRGSGGVQMVRRGVVRWNPRVRRRRERGRLVPAGGRDGVEH